jgi:hypothetical protein
VTIVALQAFYADDTNDLQTQQDYGGQDAKIKAIRADQQRNINESGLQPGGKTYRIPVTVAIDKVIASNEVDPATLVPMLGKSDVPTICPEFGRPKKLDQCGQGGSGAGSAATPPPVQDGSAAPAADGSAAAAASAAQGSAAPAAVPGNPVTPPSRGSGGHAP